MGELAGKVCVVTGGAMGLGRADADLLARAGATVVITDVNESAGRQTAEALGERVSFRRQDVSVEQDWADLMVHVLDRFDRLDVLVNNAGVVEGGDVEMAEAASWRRINAVSSDGTFFGCKHAIRAMRARPADGGETRSIINMSSISATRGYSSIVAYSAAKGAVRSMTRSVAAYCAENDLAIRCNCLLPGLMDTPMVHALIGEAAAVAPLGSAYDVAETVLFLASQRSRYINGAEFVIDNGAISRAPG